MWRVALKRCRLSLRNGWFLGTWAVAAALAVATVWVSWIDYGERTRLFDVSRMAHETAAERAQVYAQLEIGLERPPTPLSLLSRGVGEQLGSSAAIPGRYGQVRLSRRDRPVAEAARRLNVDLSWVLALVVGFACVFFAHGVINGERERGTLKQQLAKGLPRSGLLFGEFAGGVLMVVLPSLLLMLGFLAWAMVGGPALDGEDWLRVLLFFLLVALYGCFWIALSLALSVVCRKPATALVLGVLAWVLSASLYPQVAGWTASRMAPPAQGHLQGAFATEAEGGEESRDQLMARRNVLAQEYRHYRRLAALLPVTALLDAGQVLAGTAVADHQQFLRNVDNAERQFESWQTEKLVRHPERERRSVYGEPLDIEGLPEPVYQPASLTRSLTQAGVPAGTLLIGATALLAATLVGLERLDVR